jgi:hypothetical protein
MIANSVENPIVRMMLHGEVKASQVLKVDEKDATLAILVQKQGWS